MDAPKRRDILDSEVAKWSRRGYVVESEAAASVQMRRPKELSGCTALLLLVLFVPGLFIYLIWYLLKHDEMIFINIDETGYVTVQGPADDHSLILAIALLLVSGGRGSPAAEPFGVYRLNGALQHR